MTVRSLPGAGICPRPLAAQGQSPLVTHPPVAADVDQPLDVGADIFAKVPLDLLALFNDLTDLVDLVLGQRLDLLVLIDLGILENPRRLGAPDPEDIGQPDLDPFFRILAMLPSFSLVFVYASG